MTNKKNETTFDAERAETYLNATEHSYPASDQRLSEKGQRGDFISQADTEFGPLNDEIRKALLENKNINANGISFRVGKNEILLYGSVLTEADRQTAEDIVKQRAQGRSVKNEISLQH
jgi:osmotically-inducible protein OsmY